MSSSYNNKKLTSGGNRDPHGGTGVPASLHIIGIATVATCTIVVAAIAAWLLKRAK